MMVFDTPQAVQIGLPGLQLSIIVFRFRISTKEHDGHIRVPLDLIMNLILLFDRFVNVIEDFIRAKASPICNSSFKLC